MSRRVIQTLLFAMIVGFTGNQTAVAIPPGSHHRVPVVRAQGEPAYCATLQEIALLDLINGYRAEMGIGPLVLLVPLGAAARHHAESMATYNYFDFTLVPEGVTFSQNIVTFGYSGAYVGANIAAGPASFNGGVVFGQWQASPSQNENLLNPSFASIGLGSSLNSESEFVNYWAATFGGDVTGQTASGCDSGEEVATAVPTTTPTPIPSPTQMPTPTWTATVEPTATPTSTPTITPTAPPTQTETPPWVVSPTRSPTPPASFTPTATAMVFTTSTSTPTPELSPTQVATVTPSPTPKREESVSSVACAASRDSARASLEVVLSCAGFEAGEKVEVFFDKARPSSLLDTVKADKSGQIEYTFIVPEIPAGRFILIARSVDARTTATVDLDIKPGMLITPRSGDPGDVIDADLTGFQPGEAVTIFWNDESLTGRELRSITVGEDGSATTTFRAPASTAGSHTIEAVGVGGGKATATYTIES